MSTYTVQKGDKIQGLADTWETTLRGIYDANPGLKAVVAERILEHGYSLQTGEVLTVPDKAVALANSTARFAHPTTATATATVCVYTHTLTGSVTDMGGDIQTGPAPCILTVPGISPPQTSSMEICFDGYYMGVAILDGDITFAHGTDGKCIVPPKSVPVP